MNYAAIFQLSIIILFNVFFVNFIDIFFKLQKYRIYSLQFLIFKRIFKKYCRLSRACCLKKMASDRVAIIFKTACGILYLWTFYYDHNFVVAPWRAATIGGKWKYLTHWNLVSDVNASS